MGGQVLVQVHPVPVRLGGRQERRGAGVDGVAVCSVGVCGLDIASEAVGNIILYYITG